jgi:hypothetical protein
LIPPKGFRTAFLAFLGGFGSIDTFHLQARGLNPVKGSLEDSTPGLQAKIETAGIEMSPSNLGIGEIKLSKSCIQETKV